MSKKRNGKKFTPSPKRKAETKKNLSARKKERVGNHIAPTNKEQNDEVNKRQEINANDTNGKTQKEEIKDTQYCMDTVLIFLNTTNEIPNRFQLKELLEKKSG